MERLLSSSSSTIPYKLNLKASPLLQRLGRFDSGKLQFCSEFKRVSPICCKHEDPSSKSSTPLLDLQSLSSDQVESSTGSVVESHFIDLFTTVSSGQRKAITAGTVILLSALVTILIHPILAPPAFATVQATAKGGSHAATIGGKLITTGLLSSAWAGFFAGCLHTLSGADHLVALAPLSIGRTRIESAAVGALWGCGHDTGQIIFGLIFLLLKDQLHIEILQAWGARVIGLTLLLIGAMGIKEATEVPIPCVALENSECEISAYEEALETSSTGKKKIGFATFATGIVHGLQPDAMLMVLPALALPSRLAGAAYLGTFLLGTVFAMGSYTVLIGSCSQALKKRVPRITEKLTWASSLVAIALGLAIIISQFFGYSLY